MSSTGGGQPHPALPNPQDLGTVILGDLKNFGSWVENEALSIGTTVWSDIKWFFQTMGPKQVQIAYNVLGRIQDDAIAGKSIEQIESDALNEAVGDELTALAALGTGFQAIVAFYKHSVVAKRPTASNP